MRWVVRLTSILIPNTTMRNIGPTFWVSLNVAWSVAGFATVQDRNISVSQPTKRDLSCDC